MRQKKVLLITYHFPPSAASGSFRLLGFARHLPAWGWQPLVIAPPRLPGEPVDAELGAQVPADALVTHVPYPEGLPRRLRALAPWALWLPRAWSAAKRVMREQRPDAVLTSGPPHLVHLLGLWVKARFGVPWVADFRDPWISDGRKRPLTLMARWYRSWERKVLTGADTIIANAPNACRMFQDAYPESADRVVSLTNGFDPVEGGPAVEDPLRLVHAGELYAGRDPLPLLDALSKWNERGHGRAKLHVIGRNFLTLDMTRAIQERKLDGDVVLTGQLPYRAAQRAMGQAGILVLFDAPGRKIGVPAKLYEYFGAGRPILALAEPDGDVAHVLRDSGVAYRLAPPTDAGAIERALAELVPLAAQPQAPLTEDLKRYTRGQLAGDLADLLDTIVSDGRTKAIAGRVGVA